MEAIDEEPEANCLSYQRVEFFVLEYPLLLSTHVLHLHPIPFLLLMRFEGALSNQYCTVKKVNRIVKRTGAVLFARQRPQFLACMVLKVD